MNRHVVTRTVRPRRIRRVLVPAVVGAMIGSALVLAGQASPATADIADSQIVRLPADQGGPGYRVWAGENNGEVATSTRFTIPDDWIDVRYTIVGATGALAGEHQQVLGGLGASITGTVPRSVTTIELGWGVRGGAGEGNQRAGASQAPRAGRAGAGGDGAGPRLIGVFYDGGGGGGASYIGSPGDNWGFLAIAGGGGGAAGGSNTDARCTVARGGNADAPGADSNLVTQPILTGGEAVLCKAAAGGIAGPAYAGSYQPHLHAGKSASLAPGSGGGGGGYLPGYAGEVTAGSAEPFAAPGGAGGGGGGRSVVWGDSTAVIAGGASYPRGDGRVELRYYVRHSITLLPIVPTVVRAGQTAKVGFQLIVPGNTPAAELQRDGTVTATIDGVPVTSPITGDPLTGSIEDGLDLVLPPSNGASHTLCFTYQPASDKLTSSTQCATNEITVEPTVVESRVSLPLNAAEGTDPDCMAPCRVLSATALGRPLYPYFRLPAGVQLDTTVPAPVLNSRILWQDLTTGASGTQLFGNLDRRLPPQPTPATPLPPDDEGWWPYDFMAFMPDRAAPIVNHVYSIRVEWVDTTYFSFSPSETVTIKFVPGAADLTITPPSATSAGVPVTVTAQVSGQPGPRMLPLCCRVNTDELPPRRVPGDFTLTVTDADGEIVAVLPGSNQTSTNRATTETWTLAGTLPVGDYGLRVSFASADPSWTAADAVGTLEIVGNATQTELDITPASARYGTGRMLTATVTSPDSPLDTPPTGDVEFTMDLGDGDSIELGASQLDEGVATLAIPDAAIAAALPGSLGIRADYPGDTMHAPSSAEAELIVTPIAPAITSAATTTFIATTAAEFEITTTGVPAAAIRVEGDLPAGITLTDAGDGTALLAGTTREYGSFPISLIASNDGDGTTDAIQAFVLRVDVPPLPLPLVPPDGEASLRGLPPRTAPGQDVHLVGTGFAPSAPVRFAFYSTPTLLGSAHADATGTVTITVQIPTDASGPHSVVAIGMDAVLDPLNLRADTEVVPPAGTAPAAETLPATGADVPSGAAFALLSVLLGALLVVARNVRSRARPRTTSRGWGR